MSRLRMKTAQIIIIVVFTTFSIQAQIEVPAGNVSGVWTLANSPYQSNGDITVPNGHTLTIEPGDEVNFTGHYNYSLQGLILAVGTFGEIITFTAQDNVTGWNGLRFIDPPAVNDTSKIIFCSLQFGTTTQDIKSYGSDIEVEG
jgi:hypothetical protein